MRRTQWSLLMVMVAVPALAQTDGRYLLTSTNTVSPGSPTTSIGIWATWTDPNAEWVFAGGNYDLTAGDGVFSNPFRMLNAPGSTTGVIAGNVISGGIIGQVLFWPPILHTRRDNPILLATYDWTTTVFTPRAVNLHTSNTSLFGVFSLFTGEIAELYPNEFTPGSGVINVIPAPAVWVVFALPLAAATRRRRS